MENNTKTKRDTGETQGAIDQLEGDMKTTDDNPELPPRTPIRFKQRPIADFLTPPQANNMEKGERRENNESQKTTGSTTQNGNQKHNTQLEETAEITSEAHHTQTETREEI